jgi:parallel beta-helix repeat protein
VTFAGSRVSELNPFLDRHRGHSIQVSSPVILVDEPLRITGANIKLDLGRTRLQGNATPYLIRVENAQNAQIVGGALNGSTSWGMLVAASDGVSVSQMSFENLSGGGIVVTGSANTTIWENRFAHLKGSPIVLHGDTQATVVAHNAIRENLGTSNWHAGIVITDRNADLSERDPSSLLLPDNHGIKEQPLASRATIPHDNLLAFNVIDANRSSGIYIDGANRTVIVENHIENNAKEGLCLDNGAFSNVVAHNKLFGNGKRWGQTDLDLAQDFVLPFGRLPDGTSPAKLPAISVDNAAYNQIVLNNVERNFGGGIKMVRTGYFNAVGLNTLLDNNEGQSEAFHFFGIELGGAPGDVSATDLDFTPSRGNTVFNNTIRGNHYAGIFLSDGSSSNELLENVVLDATGWAIESVRPQRNKSKDNLTNSESRNIDAGLEVRRVIESAGRFDRP